MKFPLSRMMQKSPWMEALLILSIVLLFSQFFGPNFFSWWRLPRPGSTGIDYLASEFFQGKKTSCLAPGYVCYLPKRYLQGESLPLVIYLHGAGKRGNAPQELMDFGRFLSSANSSELPAIVLLPQCRLQQTWQPQDVTDLVDHTCRRYRIDRERIYLIGYSMGGYGTWAAAAAHPDLFAAIVPIAGGCDIDKAKSLISIPTWAFHGAKDAIVPASQTTELITAIREGGGEPKLTILPEAGHGIHWQVCQMDELWHWLLEQSLKNTLLNCM